jgi:hypothetical protein
MDKGQLPLRGPWPLTWMRGIFSILFALNSWPWIVLVFLVVAGFAIVRQRKERDWVFDFMAGVALMETIHQLILRI